MGGREGSGRWERFQKRADAAGSEVRGFSIYRQYGKLASRRTRVDGRVISGGRPFWEAEGPGSASAAMNKTRGGAG